MKKQRKLILFIAVIILFCSCKKRISNEPDTLEKSLNSYSFDLYRALKSDNENLFISPLSTYYALLALYEGANDDIKHEFEKVLHINNPESLANFYDYSNKLFIKKDNSNFLSLSNAMWVHKEYKIKENYKDKIKKYNSEVKTIDFSIKEIAVNQINEWVLKNTNRQIKDIITINDIKDLTRIIISNVIYFIGEWQSEFDKELTNLDIFYSAIKEEPKIDFMNKKEELVYYENSDYQFIAKPYQDDKSFCIILPKKKYGLSKIEKCLSASMLNDIISKAELQEVILKIPKFKLEGSYSLENSLQGLGLVNTFTSNTSFSNISNEDFVLGQLKHKTFIEINEKKTEAASATGAWYAHGIKENKPKVFNADHPFVFMILDNETRMILFIGRYVNP